MLKQLQLDCSVTQVSNCTRILMGLCQYKGRGKEGEGESLGVGVGEEGVTLTLQARQAASAAV